MSFTPTPINPTTDSVKPSPFIAFTQRVIPATFDQSLSYQEALYAILKYLNDMSETVNTNAAITDQQTAVIEQLTDYVNHYFDNLDVQEEINNKLDDMAEAGTLQEIITTYLQLNSGLYFDNVEDMIASTNLINGSKAHTLGYYNAGDFGDNDYIVSDTQGDFGIELDNGLYANPIIEGEELVANKFGVKCNKTFDNKDTLQNILNYCKLHNKTLIINGYAYTSATINTKGVLIKGKGTIPFIPVKYDNSIMFDYLKNTGDGANITFSQYVGDKLTSGSGIISDTANPILSCPNPDGRIRLENITVCGWLRNTSQEGIRTSYDSETTYLQGNHYFKDVLVVNCGNNGVHLQSLETTTVENLNCRLNGGDGLYIECPSDKDAPVEYTVIRDGMFDANFKNGIHIKNAFRKDLKIEHCDFSRNGLYSQLGLTPSSTQYENYGGIVIEGKQNYTLNGNQLNLIINNNYAEECCILINLNLINTSGQNSKYILNNTEITDNIIYGISGVNTTICYVNAYYLGAFTFNKNYRNGVGDVFIASNASEYRLFPRNCDNGFYATFNTHRSYTTHANASYSRKAIVVREDTVYLNFFLATSGSIAAFQNIITDMIPPVENTSFPATILRDGGNIPIMITLYTNGGFTTGTALNANDGLVVNGTYKWQ